MCEKSVRNKHKETSILMMHTFAVATTWSSFYYRCVSYFDKLVLAALGMAVSVISGMTAKINSLVRRNVIFANHHICGEKRVKKQNFFA